MFLKQYTKNSNKSHLVIELNKKLKCRSIFSSFSVLWKYLKNNEKNKKILQSNIEIFVIYTLCLSVTYANTHRYTHTHANIYQWVLVKQFIYQIYKKQTTLIIYYDTFLYASLWVLFLDIMQ